MRKIIVGQFDRVFGVVGLDHKNNWLLEPQDATPEELNQMVEELFARAQFLEQFFAKTGGPKMAHAASLWGKRVLSPQLLALLDRLSLADDPFLAELRQHDQDILLRVQALQRA